MSLSSVAGSPTVRKQTPSKIAPIVSESRLWTARDALAGALQSSRTARFRAELFKRARRELSSLTDEELNAALAAMTEAGNIEARQVNGRTMYWHPEMWERYSGLPEASSPSACPRCDGTGITFESHTNDAGHRITEDIPCPLCAPAPAEDRPCKEVAVTISVTPTPPESRRLSTAETPRRPVPREETPPREWPVWALKMRHEYEAKLIAAERRIAELEMSIMETNKAQRIAENNRSLALYGDSDDVKGLTTRLQYMLPNADKLGTKGVALVAQVAVMHGLDPLPGSDHLYAWKDDKGNINVVVGYKGLLHLARKQVRFTHVSRAMTVAERDEHGLSEKEIGYITELYEIASAIECRQAGIPYHPLIGSARWKPGDKVPAGRTPAWVAKKNSLKDALRQIVTTGTRLQEAIDGALQQFASQLGAEYTGEGWRLETSEQDEQSLIAAGIVPPNEDGEADGEREFASLVIDMQSDSMISEDEADSAPPEPAPAHLCANCGVEPAVATPLGADYCETCAGRLADAQAAQK